MNDFCMPVTCAECPWRRDVPIGRFPPERYALLKDTCSPGWYHPLFACHKSLEGNDRACAGFVLMHGENSNAVRLAVIRGRFRPDEIRAAAPLFENFAEMARANGYDPDC